MYKLKFGLLHNWIILYWWESKSRKAQLSHRNQWKVIWWQCRAGKGVREGHSETATGECEGEIQTRVSGKEFCSLTQKENREKGVKGNTFSNSANAENVSTTNPQKQSNDCQIRQIGWLTTEHSIWVWFILLSIKQMAINDSMQNVMAGMAKIMGGANKNLNGQNVQ